MAAASRSQRAAVACHGARPRAPGGPPVAGPPKAAAAVAAPRRDAHPMVQIPLAEAHCIPARHINPQQHLRSAMKCIVVNQEPLAFHLDLASETLIMKVRDSTRRSNAATLADTLVDSNLHALDWGLQAILTATEC